MTGERLCDGVTLYEGDCREVLPLLAPSSAGLVFTDPPYGMTDLSWDCEVPMADLWPLLDRSAEPDAAFIFTASQPFTAAVVMSRPAWFRSEWIWKKNAGSNFATVKWHPMKEHESVLVFGRGVTTYNPIRQPRSAPYATGKWKASNTGKRKAYKGVEHSKGFVVTDGEMRVPSSVQCFNRERGLHPNQKPLDLCDYFVRTYSDPGDVVLDCFAESETVGVAALKAGRRAVLIESDPVYCATIRKRMGELAGVGSLFAESTP